MPTDDAKRARTNIHRISNPKVAAAIPPPELIHCNIKFIHRLPYLAFVQEFRTTI